MPVDFDAATGTFLISTPGGSYALRRAGAELRHVHWGGPLTLEQAATVPVPEVVHEAFFDPPWPGAGELAALGGSYFGVAGLLVRFADDARALELGYAGHDIDGEELRVRLADSHYPLEVTLHYRAAAGSDVIERWTTLRHTGTEGPIAVLRADSAAWPLPRRDGYRLSHVTGHWAGETRLERVELPRGETTLTSRRGITSQHANPWVMIDAGDADERRGEVWSAALAWSGSWRITLARTPTDEVGLTGGYGHDGVSLRLAPGGVLRTPVLAGLWTAGGFGAASRAWHGYLRARLPHPEELRPVLYNSWEATTFDVTEENQLRLAAAAAALGVELFVVDDGWFGRRLDDAAGLGDWVVNPDRFPRGLKPLVDEVHRLGMRFGLWVEPEMVNPASGLYAEHPDWVLHEPNRRRTELRNQLVLNLARDDVAAWTHEWLDRLVRDNEIDFLKWDMNRPFTEAGWPGAGDGDPDRLWVAYVENLYGILDRLRADHPHLRVESCAGGGGRVDPAILTRTDEVWTSDNTDAVDRLSIQHGFSQIYPAAVMAAWVTDSPNFLNGRRVPLDFRFHVAMTGVLGVGGNLPEWTAGELARARELIARYKAIRPVVQHGLQYRLRAPGGPPPAAVQYVAADGSATVVFAYRVSPAFGHRPTPLRLAGLEPAARYRDEATGAEYHGAVLLTHGLPLDLPPGDHASTLAHLTRVAG
ncbi:alpha-galactosidase [Rhizomonospora bruguierae]|uniref:alpha-galactosidase n=1 Tax=Rhizomonospora bruguierae TaxID=1581705 RepID=UPI001BCDE5B4|nr:alpha-galactosidase [Micromonospora sp. NBRC 107566]